MSFQSPFNVLQIKQTFKYGPEKWMHAGILPFQPAILKQKWFSLETADMLQLISSLYLPRGQCIWSCISSMQWLYTTCLKTYVGAVTVVFCLFWLPGWQFRFDPFSRNALLVLTAQMVCRQLVLCGVYYHQSMRLPFYITSEMYSWLRVGVAGL